MYFSIFLKLFILIAFLKQYFIKILVLTNGKGSFICTIPYDRIAHTTTFVIPVVDILPRIINTFCVKLLLIINFSISVCDSGGDINSRTNKSLQPSNTRVVCDTVMYK